MKYLIEILKTLGFDKSILEELGKYMPRDGFDFLKLDDYNNMVEYLSQYYVYQNIIPIMTNNNSDYICVYKEGILYGKVCYLNHEETSLEPKFKDIKTLIQAINTNPDCWELMDFPETVFDYPQKDETFSEEDRRTISLLYDSFNTESDDDMKIQKAFSIMSLTPPENLMDIYSFLDSEDMYIQERAIKVFGFHRYKPVVDKLRDLQTTAQHNGKFAAKLALRRMET